MSLINDALKRAKQTQQENPPATPPLVFRPIEPDQQRNRRSALLYVGLTCVTVAIVGLSGLLVYFISQSKSNTLTVAARVNDAPLAALPVTDTNSPATPAPIQPPTEPVVTENAPGYIERPDEPNTNGMPAAVALDSASLIASGLGAETAIASQPAVVPASMSWACLAGSLLVSW